MQEQHEAGDRRLATTTIVGMTVASSKQPQQSQLIARMLRLIPLKRQASSLQHREQYHVDLKRIKAPVIRWVPCREIRSQTKSLDQRRIARDIMVSATIQPQKHHRAHSPLIVLSLPPPINITRRQNPLK